MALRLTLLEHIGNALQTAVEWIANLIAVGPPPKIEYGTSCPNCGATCIVRKYPLIHCNQCGYEWTGRGLPDLKLQIITKDTRTCPDCESSLIVWRGRTAHCNACGWEGSTAAIYNGVVGQRGARQAF